MIQEKVKNKDSISTGKTTRNKRKAGAVRHKTKLRNKRLKSLAKGSVKNIGFFEALRLKTAGRIDGAGGLPRQTDDSLWYSPFMNRETNGYEEFCSCIWGTLQLENEESYARLGELLSSIQQTQVLLVEAKCELLAAAGLDSYADAGRKKGEENLTDAQMKSRRASEREKRLVPLKNRIGALECRMSDGVAELSELYSRLVEDDNTTRIICHRVKAHTLQRLDLYWNAALKKHPDSNGMPVVPAVDLTENAERVYMESHEKLMDRAETLRIQLIDVTADKEVA